MFFCIVYQLTAVLLQPVTAYIGKRVIKAVDHGIDQAFNKIIGAACHAAKFYARSCSS